MPVTHMFFVILKTAHVPYKKVGSQLSYNYTAIIYKVIMLINMMLSSKIRIKLQQYNDNNKTILNRRSL